MTTATQTPSGGQELVLVAPVAGVMVPLADVPDPVFAEKMLGDGIAIDPVGTDVVAPCAGKIVQLHRAKHAFTVQTQDGVSVLVHVGLDTVNLKGEGFTAIAKEGDAVQAGAPVLSFDLDGIAQGAKSALTLVVVTEGAPNGVSVAGQMGAVVAAGTDAALRVAGSAKGLAPGEAVSGQASGPTGKRPTAAAPATILNPNGMHARPAARLGQAAKGLDAVVYVDFEGKSAKATSVFEILGLDLGRGANVTVRAEGPQAHEAVDKVVAAIADGLGEPTDAPNAPHAADATTAAASPSVDIPDRPGVLTGVAAAPGVAIGKLSARQVELPPMADTSDSPETAQAEVDAAVAKTLAALAAEEKRFKAQGQDEKAQIFGAHQALLQEPDLMADVKTHLADGASAAKGWWLAIDKRVSALKALKSAMLRERADDMKDVGLRVLFNVVGQEMPRPALGPDRVLLAEDLTRPWPRPLRPRTRDLGLRLL